MEIDGSYVLGKLQSLFVGIIVIVVAHIVGSTTSKGIVRVSRNVRSDQDGRGKSLSGQAQRQREAVVQNLGRFSYYVIMIVGFTIVFRMFGIEIATIIALLSTAGFILGMSLQGTLSDIASGIIIAFFQTYHIGDIVKVEEMEGEVIDFRLINTVLKHVDSGVIFSVPNSKMQGSIVTNYTREPYYVYSFTYEISNNNKDVGEILRQMAEDLRSEKKYPSIVRPGKDGAPDDVPLPRVAAVELSGWGMTIVIRVPLHFDMSIGDKRDEVRTGLRLLLNELNVTMMNRGETNLDDEKAGDLHVDKVEKRRKRERQKDRTDDGDYDESVTANIIVARPLSRNDGASSRSRSSSSKRSSSRKSSGRGSSASSG